MNSIITYQHFLVGLKVIEHKEFDKQDLFYLGSVIAKKMVHM